MKLLDDGPYGFDFGNYIFTIFFFSILIIIMYTYLYFENDIHYVREGMNIKTNHINRSRFECSTAMFLAIFLCFSPMISSSILVETSPAQCVELIDQQYCELNDPVQAHIYNNYLAQSFIPSKPVLSSVDLQLIYPDYDVNVTIYKAKVNGYPDLSNPLTNISTNVFHSYGNYGFWYKFDFMDIPVVPGDTYFIRVEVLEENSLCNWVQGANGYENGSAWSFLLRDDFGFEHTERDYFFRTYYSTTGFYPVADAGPDRQVLVNNLVNFSGACSYDPDWQALTYIWYLGGEIIHEGMEFQYQFTHPGIYTIDLTVTDETGLADSDSCVITVIEPELPPNQMPVPIIEAKGYLGHYYNLPANHSEVECNITGIVTGDSPFNHDWYDEQYYSFTRLDPNLTFGNDFFPVNEGMPGDPLYFAVHWETTIDVPVTANYSFEIGSDDDSWVYVDNQMVCDLGGIHALAISAHTVNLTVGQHELDIYFAERRSVQSGFYFSFLDETVNPSVILSDFNGTIRVFANQSIELSAEKSYDPDGTVVHYAWNFGDGTIEYNSTIVHKYSVEGEYSLIIYILDNNGNFSKVVLPIEVVPFLPKLRMEESNLRINDVVIVPAEENIGDDVLTGSDADKVDSSIHFDNFDSMSSILILSILWILAIVIKIKVKKHEKM